MMDTDIKRDVLIALEREPGLDPSAIAVAVDNGVVTLRGEVGTYFEKYDAERVAMHIDGVNAVANDVAVRPPDGHELGDTEIAQGVVDALTWNALVPLHRVRVVVADGWVTLTGTLDWEYQRTSAEHSALGVTGVKGVSNAILLEAAGKPLRPPWTRRESPVT